MKRGDLGVGVSRRAFLAAGAGFGLFNIVPSSVLGADAPSGKVELTISNLSRTSLVADSMSIPYLKVRVRKARFSLDWEFRSFRSATPFKAFSRTFVRLFSTSSALAPG